MKLLYILLFLILTYVNYACQKLWFCEDEELTMPQTGYNGNLKLNGYYYHEKDAGYRIYILYNNGVVVNWNSTESTLSEIETTYLLSKGYKSVKTKWGLFRITNSTIAIQSWRISQCKRPVVEFRGDILTDTSFNIKTYIDENDETNVIDESTYYFKEFSPKPDSTNDFIN